MDNRDVSFEVNGKVIIDSDPTFIKFCELSELNDSQYELEAHEIITMKQLTKLIGKFQINYTIDENKCSFEILDPTHSNEVIAGNYAPVGHTEASQIDKLKSYLAQSEAIATVRADN